MSTSRRNSTPKSTKKAAAVHTCKFVEDHFSAAAKASVETEACEGPAICAADRIDLRLCLLLGPSSSSLAVAVLLLLFLQLLAPRHDSVVCGQHRRLQLAVHVTLAKGVEGGGVQLVWKVALAQQERGRSGSRSSRQQRTKEKATCQVLCVWRASAVTSQALHAHMRTQRQLKAPPRGSLVYERIFFKGPSNAPVSPLAAAPVHSRPPCPVASSTTPRWLDNNIAVTVVDMSP